MGLRVPPPPLSPEEFTRRWRAGARTLEELDPALWRWQKGIDRQAVFMAVAIFVGVVGLAFFCILLAVGR